MAESLYFYKLVSEYPEDVTKNCKLTINEIDSNFKVLKDYDIKTAEFVRDEDCTKAAGTLVITRNNGDKIIVPIDTTLCKNLAYDLKVNAEDCNSGKTLTISYKDDDGENEVVIENIITRDNISDVIGSDILTKVISDNTLKGLGTMSSPLGIAGVETTGMLAPAIKLLDLTDGSKLPKYAKEGTRFVTREYVSDYGYLYNGSGVNKISALLDDVYEKEEIYKEVEDRKYYWRVPSKADWDKLLNSIEPCKYKNHNSAQCHVELGKYAGKFLKSECGCIGGEYPQEECHCNSTKAYTGCTNNASINQSNDIDDYVFDNTDTTVENKKLNPSGVDKYGMTILPSGISIFKNGTPRPSGFGEMSVYWTTSHIYDDPQQDIYLKVFECDKSGVYQLAECPSPYYSVRLVKDYDGSNYRETEYIDGVLYKAILFPESGQIWLASNFANTNGFIGYNEIGGENATPDYLEPNNGDGISDKRIEMFINEFNGRYWEKKVMEDGVTIVIQNPCFDGESGTTEEVCWKDSEGIEHCLEVFVPKVAQSNIEYRVYIEEDTCDKVLKNTDDLVVERVLAIILPILEQERFERIEADAALSGAIDTEREERISADTELWEALITETEERIKADEFLSGAIDTEREERIAADEVLSGAIDTEREERIAADEVLSGAIDDLRDDLEQEVEERKAADEFLSGAIDTEREERIAADIVLDGQLIDWSKNPFIMSASTSFDEAKNETKPNVVLETKDGNEEHFIKIKFDGNFGEI